MAQPTTALEVWARDNVDLPVTGEANKQRPIDDLWSKGYDRGQKPACEEFNYVIYMLSSWLKYIQNEGLPSYLPINGTKITFGGDLTGTATFSGSSQTTAQVQVVDNSHNHVSANITDATSQPTPNMIVRRGSQGEASFGRVVYGFAPSGGNFDYTLVDQSNGTQRGGFAWDRASNVTTMYVGPGNAQAAGVYVYGSGYVEITRPRSNVGQEGQANSLVRFDYLTSTANNLSNSFNASINNTNQTVANVNNDLQNYKNSAYNTFVSDIRLGSTYTKLISKNNAILADGGGVLIGYYFEGDNPQGDTLYMKPIQKAVGGNWYTIGQL